VASKRNQPMPVACIVSFQRALRGAVTRCTVSTVCAIVLSLFPAEDDANPGATLAKILVMTLVLLGAGIAIYVHSDRALRAANLARSPSTG